MKLDIRDWIVSGILILLTLVGCVYIFLHPSDMAFATWAGFTATLTGAFHYLNIQDSKVPDHE